MTQTSYDQRNNNDLKGLLWVNTFGWLRTAELGRLMWPNDIYSRTRADRVARGWLDRALVIPRPLPDGAGRAIVLSEAGARLLRDGGHEEVRSGKDWGERKENIWHPYLNWRHDLLAAGILVRLYESGYTVIPENELRKTNSNLIKIPDGLAILDDKVVWLEVEHARKSGKAMVDLAKALAAVADGGCASVSGFRPTSPLVGYADLPDERGYRLDHRARITNALRCVAKADVLLGWAKCTLSGCGVASMQVTLDKIESDITLQILGRLNACGWKWVEEEGIFLSHYDGHQAIVWDDDDHGWSFCIDDGAAGQASSKTEAMQGCAAQLVATHSTAARR